MKNELFRVLGGSVCLSALLGFSVMAQPELDVHVIELQSDQAMIDHAVIEEYDYTWHCDPGAVHDEVEYAPAEYYTGTVPETDAAVYIDHELYYYPKLEESGFKLVNYDGEREWAYYYTDGVNDDYIFATLPALGNSLPSQMMHSEEDAALNKVLHITKAGTYLLTGTWNGQIKVDLGEEAFDNPEEKVTLILDGVDVTCTVAPGIIFQNVYECDNAWEDTERTDASIDTSGAGAVILLADDSENHISGANVFRMLKTKYKDEDSADEVKTQKKMRKTDGALYSYMTMNINGETQGNGTLTVDSGFEGIDSELHLTVNGGVITVNSQDDGINVNEDNESVLSFLGGNVTLNAALGLEGDGADSNGYIMINGGTIQINGIRVPDSALDSENGIYYQNGQIIIDGEEQSYEPGSVFRETREDSFGRGGLDEGGFPGAEGPSGDRPDGEMPFGDRPDGEMPFGGRPDGEMPFGGRPNPENFDLQEFKDNVAALSDDATYEDVLALLR